MPSSADSPPPKPPNPLARPGSAVMTTASAGAVRQRATSLGQPNRMGTSAGSGFSERRRSSILVGQRSVDLLMEHPGEPGPCFVLFVIRMYRRWGYFIADHDWQAMLVCMLTSIIGLYFVLMTPQQNDITGYAPPDARARLEYTQYQDYFSRDGPSISVYIFALARDGGSMLRSDYLNETVRVLNLANTEVQLHDNHNRSLPFAQFCRSFCDVNDPVPAFYNGFVVQSEQAQGGQRLSGRINLDYPVAHIFGRSFTLQQSFFGIEFHNETVQEEGPPNFNLTAALLSVANDSSLEENGTSTASLDGRQQQRVTNMREMKMVVLQFRAEHETGWTTEIVKAYEMAMVERFQRQYHSERLQLFVLSTTYVEEEMVRAGISMLPFLTIGFFSMVLCSVVSVLIRALYMHQHSPPKVFLAIAACVLPFMSCATGLGLMFVFGTRFASILCVIPFLVLSIGVDSSYLMIHEWQRVIKHCRQQPNRKNCYVGYRISQVLSEVGPAILISTLTNIFADGVGAYTSSPEIRRLCLGNMISMMIAFVYQMTFYAGLMSLVGRYEISVEKRERRELQESIRRAIGAQNGATAEMGLSGKPPLMRQQSKFHEHTKHYISESMLVYVNFVANQFVAIITVCLYFAYLAISIWGITRININLSTQKLFTQDSPLLALDKLRVQYQVPHFTMATVFVSNPGNLSDPQRLGRMNDFVEEMEQLKGNWGHSWGTVGTQYFVRDFITFEDSTNGEEPDEFTQEETSPLKSDDDGGGSAGSTVAPVEVTTKTPNGPFNEDDLATFLNWPEYKHWVGFVKLSSTNKTKHLQRFFFTTGYHGEELKVWTERGKLLNQWRAVVDKYNIGPNGFNASVFHQDAIFLDLIDNMPTDTWQSVVGTLVCMAAVCFLFLNSMFTVVIAASCVLSICCGILGILSWWGIDLDPITMAAMIISIGFSVDIPAHVSYHYYQASVREFDATPQMKLVNCLSSVAFPALQAALSTALCVSSLLLVHLYMAEVFVKTMVLCVALCNLHGLVFLPAFLILFDSLVQLFQSPSKEKVRDQQQRNGKSRQQRPAPIKEESSQESSIEYKNGGQKRLNGATHIAVGASAPKKAPEQSTVTDRPKLERFYSVDHQADGVLDGQLPKAEHNSMSPSSTEANSDRKE